MNCFLEQGKGRRPLFGGAAAEECTVLGVPMQRVEYFRPDGRGVLRTLKKNGVTGFAQTPDLPQGLAQQLLSAGFSAYDGKALMALMLPDILRHLQKLHRLDASVPIAVYGKTADDTCRRAVYDASAFSRRVCLICPDGERLADEVLEQSGQAIALRAPEQAHISVWCGAAGERGIATVNLCKEHVLGTINALTLSIPDGGRIGMALAETALCDNLCRDTVCAAGLKLTVCS